MADVEAVPDRQPRKGGWKFWRWEMTLDSLASFLLLLGLVCIMQGAILVVLHEQGHREMGLRQPSIRIDMAPTAAEEQVQRFIQAVLSLPQVREATYIPKGKQYERERQRRPAVISFYESNAIGNPFHDVVDVSLSSRDGGEAFLQFLMRPELIGVIGNEVIPEAFNQIEELYTDLAWHRSAQYILLIIALCVVLLTLLSTIHIARVSVRKRKSELLVGYLSGASRWFLRKKIFVEVLSLLLSALAFASIAVLFICSFRSAPLLGTLRTDYISQWGFWILLVEILIFALVGYIAVALNIHDNALGRMVKKL
jgi:cell division protein FtsX